MVDGNNYTAFNKGQNWQSKKNESVIPDTYAGSPINYGCVSTAGIHPQI